jgi:3-ketosteroid 9alpha-monooxygenase subunit A
MHDALVERRVDLRPRRGRAKELPPTSMPTGWFQVGWSGDFPAGQAVPLHYFGVELVAYRGRSGAVHVLDAFCPHMGAHLGHGGTVEGDCIRCPYHGWLYDETGGNVEIPYGDQHRIGVRSEPWPVHEVDGVVLVFSGEAPVFDAPATFARSEYETWPLEEFGVRLWPGQAMVPQLAADNVTDAAHFKFVHRSNDHAQLVGFDDRGVPFRAEYSIRFGGGLPSTWATPEGPIDGGITTESWGVGLLWNRLGGYDDVTSMLGVTPIDAEHSDVRVSVWVPKTRGDGTELSESIRDKWIREQHGQVESDLVIWTNQTYVAKAPFVRVESPGLRAYRQWSRQFYSA